MFGRILDFVLHLDRHLGELVQQYGAWVYAVLALVIFAETAVVIFPFLPGDSLLFAVGLLSVGDRSELHFGGMYFLLTAAAVLGNVVNYSIGRRYGPGLFSRPRSRIFSPGNLRKTEEFFEKYGDKAIVITRFVPVIRAFAPFVAGMSRMDFRRFMIVNILGGALWVGVCMGAGGLLGNIPAVKNHFELAILGLVAVSILPIVFEVVVHKMKARRSHAARPEAVEPAPTAE